MTTLPQYPPVVAPLTGQEIGALWQDGKQCSATLEQMLGPGLDLMSQYLGSVLKTTWAALSVVTGSANQLAIVMTDSGTHTDPVIGGTVNNSGLFEWSASPAGWQRISDTLADLASASAAAAAASAAEFPDFISSFSETLTIGQPNPTGGATITSNTTTLMGQTVDDTYDVPAVEFRALAAGTVKVGVADIGTAGNHPPASAITTINVTSTGVQTHALSGLTIGPDQLLMFYDGQVIARSASTPAIPAVGYYSNSGDQTGATNGVVDTSLDASYRWELNFTLTRQSLDATTFAAEQADRQTTDQKIDAQARRNDWDSRVELVFGDSRAAQEITALSGINVANIRGPGEWASILSNQLITSQPTLNQGIGGQTTAQFLARIQNAVWSRAKVVRICGFLNDSAQNVDSLTVTQPNILAIVTALRNAGKLVILHDDYPATILTGPQMIQHALTRDYVRSLHNPSQGISVAYTWDLLATVPNGTVMQANMLNPADNTHPTVLGAFTEAPAIVTAWQALGFVDPRQLDALATNLTTNPGMTGDSGIVPSGASGSVADGWTASLTDTGGTAAFSVVDFGDGRESQQIVMGGTWASSVPGINITQDLGAGEFAAGNIVELYCDFQLDAGSAGIRAISAGVYYQNGTYAGVSGFESPAQPFPTSAIAGRFGTRFTWPSGATRTTAVLAIATQQNNPTVSMRLTDFRLRKVAA